MLAALTASKLKDHENVLAKRQDNALTAGEFRAATGSASPRDQIPQMSFAVPLFVSPPRRPVALA